MTCRDIASVPHLMAIANSLDCNGEHACFYCGAPCGNQFLASEYVKSSFTGRSGVRSPGSEFVCQGCALCLREVAEIQLIDGTLRSATVCAMRGYSWVISESSARAATKAHLSVLRTLLLGSQRPPWAVVLSDSGQKHLLYLGAVNRSAEPPFTVTLEMESILYTPETLADRIRLCSKIVAASGKPALAAAVNFRLAELVMARYRDGESLIENWSRVRTEPLSRLAAWLCPPREESQRDHPAEA